MHRSLPFVFSVLVAVSAVGMTIDEGHALGGRCGRKGCQPSSGKPAQPAPAKPPPTKPTPSHGTQPVKNPTQPINVVPLPLPNFWGQNPNGRPVLMCDSRAHSEAIIKFQAKIAAARQRILQGLSDGASKHLTQCNNVPALFRKTCCTTVKNVAARKCKENVEGEALADTECTFRPVNCRLFPRPIQCIKAKKTEEIRSQCCSWLAPQGKADLLAYCDVAAQQVQDQSGACSFAEVPTIPSETPIVALPSPEGSPEPVSNSPLEPVVTASAQQPSGDLPNLMAE